MMANNRPTKGYGYEVDEDQIRRYAAVPTEQKLQWLAEANQFLAKALTGKRRQVWQAFRDGKI